VFKFILDFETIVSLYTKTLFPESTNFQNDLIDNLFSMRSHITEKIILSIISKFIPNDEENNLFKKELLAILEIEEQILDKIVNSPDLFVMDAKRNPSTKQEKEQILKNGSTELKAFIALICFVHLALDGFYKI
ncbi:hypothetical protein MHBO_003858, partial [Bonamia ostreae]